MKTSLYARTRAGAAKKNNPGLLAALDKQGPGKTLEPQTEVEAPLPVDAVTGVSIFTAIKNDVHACPVVVKPSAADKAKYAFLKLPFAFARCMEAPGQSFEIMLEAFSKLPQYVLVASCNWSSNAYAQALYKTYSSCSNIHMLDPLSDPREINMLGSSSFIYVHGCTGTQESLQLAKAMVLGLPVIVYYSTGNRALTANKAFYYSTAAELREIVFTKSVIDLRMLGMQMRNIATGF